MIHNFIKKFMEEREPLPDKSDVPASLPLPELPEEQDAADEETLFRYIEAVYPELKRIAALHMRRERGDHTLQPTALVSELFLVLARDRNFTIKGRAHFLALASRAMRRLLIDHARSHNAEVHGGGVVRVELDLLKVADGTSEFDMLHIEELLNRLATEEPRMARVVELKCFGGLTYQEIAEVLKIDERTAKRDWQVARAWLYGHLKSGKGNAG
jgi:RNA polymerase sigma factor (TIGR02999 family)